MALHRIGFEALAVNYGGVRGPDWHGGVGRRAERQVERLGGEWVLVVHSAAGGFVPSIIAAARSAPKAVIFVDAILPHPGLCWLETAPAGLAARVRSLSVNDASPPWGEWFAVDPADALIADPDVLAEFSAGAPRVPMAFLEAPAPVLEIVDFPAGYLQLSAAYEVEADQARRNRWAVAYGHTHHLAMLTEPDRVARMIADLTTAVMEK